MKDLAFVPVIEMPLTIFCDNSRVVANPKEPQSQNKAKHIERKYHLIRNIVQRGDVMVAKIAYENVADPFTKALPQKSFNRNVEGMGVKVLGA